MSNQKDILALADRLEECVSDWSCDMKDAAFSQLIAFPDELRTLAAPSAGVGAGDAVFAFAALITSLPKVVPFGAAAWATPGADLAAAFNEANGLTVSTDYPQGLKFPEITGDLLDTIEKAAANTPPQVEYDRELLADMLDVLITFGDKLAGFTYRSINDQIALLRAADDRDAAGVHTAIATSGDASANEWKQAVINELVTAYILTAEHETNPRKAIQDAITWNCQVALDPAVSSDARALIERGRNAPGDAEEVADGFALVPTKMYVDADAWESASFAFGGPATGEGEAYRDCTLWVGEVEQDDGSKLHGLHVSCDECPEEGCITLAQFRSKCERF